MMNTPENRLASVSLAAKPTAMPTIPADASQAVMSTFQAVKIRYTDSTMMMISARFMNNGRVCGLIALKRSSVSASVISRVLQARITKIDQTIQAMVLRIEKAIWSNSS